MRIIKASQVRVPSEGKLVQVSVEEIRRIGEDYGYFIFDDGVTLFMFIPEGDITIFADRKAPEEMPHVT